MSVSTIKGTDSILFGISSSSETKERSSKQSFHFTYCAEDAFLQRLYALGIIDHKGNILKGKGDKLMPPLSSNIQQTTRDLLYKQHSVGGHSFILAPLLNGVQPNSDLEFAGGFVRQQLMNDENYLREALKILTGEEIEIPSELLSEALRALPDIDTRILCPKDSTEEFLLEKIQSVAEKITKKTAEILNKRLFSKPRVITEKDIHYSIIAINCLPRPFELIFWTNGRTFLFTTDALRFFIPSPFGISPITLKTELGNGWQTLIDLLGKVVRVLDPHQVNHRGFPKLIPYLTRGYVCADKDTIPILLEESLKLIPGYYDRNRQLTDLLKISCKSKDKKIEAVNFCNAFFYLEELPTEAIETMWSKLMKNKLLFKTPPLPLLASLRFGSLIAACTNEPNHRFTIRNPGENPVIQFFYQGKECTLLVPFDLKKCFATEVPESLLPIVEEIIFNHPEGKIPTDNPLDVDFEQLKKEADHLLKSEKSSSRYLGFLLLCAFPEKSNLILKLLPEMFHYRKDQKLLSFVSKAYPDHAQLILSYTEENKLKWVQGLIATRNQELIKIAALFWKEHRVKNHDLTVAFEILPHSFEAAFFFFNSHLKENPKSQEELKFVAQLLDKASNLQKFGPNLYKLLSEIFTRHEGVGLDEFTFPLKRFIERLIELEIYDVALQTIELFLPQIPTIKKSWDNWLKAVAQNQDEAGKLVERIKILAAAPTPTQETIYWEALRVLFLRESTTATALERLVELKNNRNEQVAQIAQAKIEASFEKRDLTAPFEKYRFLLTPPLLEKNLKRLLRHNLDNDQPVLAFNCWKQLNPPDESLTIPLLKALIAKKNLNQAYFILRKLDQSAMITADQRISYFIEIFDALETPTLVIIQSLLENLQAPHREIVSRVVPVLKTYQEIPEGLRVALHSSFPFLIETLGNEQRFSDGDILMTTLQIPLNNSTLCSFYQQALDHSIAKNQTNKSFERLEQLRPLLDNESFQQLVLKISSQMNPQNQVRLINDYSSELQQAMGKEKFRELVFSILFRKEISEETSNSLIQKYPPQTLSEWKIVFEKASPEIIAKIWAQFDEILPVPEPIGEIIEKLAERMSGKKEWLLFLLLKNNLFLHYLHEENQDQYESICLAIIKKLIIFPELKEQLFKVVTTINIEEVGDPQKCAEWLMILKQLEKIEIAYQIAITYIDQHRNSPDPILQASINLLLSNTLIESREEVLELYYNQLLELLKLKLPLKLRLDFAEELLKMKQFQTATDLLSCYSGEITELRIRFADIYSQSLLAHIEKSETIDTKQVLEKLKSEFPMILCSPKALENWKYFTARVLVKYMLDPELASVDFLEQYVFCTQIFTAHIQQQKEKNKLIFQWSKTVLVLLLETPKNYSKEWYEFAFKVICSYIQESTHKKNEILPLVDLLIFSVLPHSPHFKGHLSNLMQIISNYASFFHQEKRYIDFLGAIDINDALGVKRAIQKTLAFKSHEAVCYAMSIFITKFDFFKEKDHELIESITLILNQIPLYPTLFKSSSETGLLIQLIEKTIPEEIAGKIYKVLLDNLWILYEKTKDVETFIAILNLFKEMVKIKSSPLHRETILKIVSVINAFPEIPPTLKPTVNAHFPMLLLELMTYNRNSEAEVLISRVDRNPSNDAMICAYYVKALQQHVDNKRIDKIIEKLNQLKLVLADEHFLKLVITITEAMDPTDQAILLREYPELKLKKD